MDKYAESWDPLSTSRKEQNVDAFFNPRSVAVVGATDRPGVGRVTMENLKGQNFKGKIYPINPKRKDVLGLPAYPTLRACPTVPDLVIVLVPAKIVQLIIDECCAIRVKAVIVISSGFKEVGPAGKALEDKIADSLRKCHFETRVVGPNCFGIMDSASGLNATFAQEMCLPGNIAIVSQSGAMGACLLSLALASNIGFSKFVSVGSMLDVDYADLLEYLADDSNTHAILAYMESVGDAHRFLTIARQVALQKPIVCLKAGRTEAAAQAAVSHTGSLAGSDKIVDAAFDRAGVVRLESISGLFRMAQVLDTAPLPSGPRMAIVTHAGGPGVMAADALVAHGGELSKLSPESMEALNSFLPPHWSHGNPIDLTGAATPQTYQMVLDVLKNDPTVDAIYVFLGPLNLCPGPAVAQIVRTFAREWTQKPLLTCLMGGNELDYARLMLARAGLPCFLYADEGPITFCEMWKYRQHLKRLNEVSTGMGLDAAEEKKGRDKVDGIVKKAMGEGVTVLSEAQSKEVLAAYQVPVCRTNVATTADDAVKAADEIQYPVVVKLHSEIITHKSDVGGVLLNIGSAQAVRDGFAKIKERVDALGKGDKAFLGVTVQPMLTDAGLPELFIGAMTDVQFGPTIVFGHGGCLVEVVRDSAIAIPPLTPHLAKDLILRTKVYDGLTGFRGAEKVDLDKLADVLVNFSEMLVHHREIKEVDINPLFVSASRIVAVDARVVLHGAGDTIPPFCVTPYPLEHVGELTLADGSKVNVRPHRPADEKRVIEFHRGLEDAAVYSYFGASLSFEERTEHARMVKVIHGDYSHSLVHMAFAPEDSQKILGVVRVNAQRGGIAVLSAVMNLSELKRLGKELMQHAVESAKRDGLCCLITDVRAKREGKDLPNGVEYRRVLESLGFRKLSESELKEVLALDL